MSFNVLLHVVSLNKSSTKILLMKLLMKMKKSLPGTVWTFVRFVSSVDLPVSVETAGVSQQLPTLLTLDTWLT